jgi:hypothetical protein
MNFPHLKKILSYILRWGIVITGLLIVALGSYVYAPVLRSPEDGYLARKGTLQTVRITQQWSDSMDSYAETTLLSDSGLAVQLLVRKPQVANGSLPVVVLLGGVRTGRDACKLIPAIGNVMCVSLNYPYHGKPRLAGMEILYNLREIQQAVKDTPPAVMLTLDYILSQPGIAARRVELVGISFGAFLASTPAVLDQRVTRLWLVQGAAEPIKVIQHNMKDAADSSAYKTVIATLGGYAIGSQHVDPARWVGRMSPRPVTFINTEQDEALPPASVALLHAAARQPNEVIWTKGTHVTPGRQDIIGLLSDIVIKRIEQAE